MSKITANDFIAPLKFKHISGNKKTNLFANSKTAKMQIKTEARLIRDLSHKIYAQKKHAVLIILQGMDCSGKDGSIKALFSRTPPLNLRVESFKKPSKKELAHDYLWRIHKKTPAKGEITVFNRSHYEDVLVVKVRKLAPGAAIAKRYRQINDFEQYMVENDIIILKFWLDISKKVQGERLKARLETPEKRWKFNPRDLEDRLLWKKYMKAYEIMVKRTSTDHAPWYIIPSDHKPTRNAIITSIVRQKLQALNPQYPDPGYRIGDFKID